MSRGLENNRKSNKRGGGTVIRHLRVLNAKIKAIFQKRVFTWNHFKRGLHEERHKIYGAFTTKDKISKEL